MILSILSVVLALCLFVVPLLAYRQGLQDGLNIKNDKPIVPLKSPTLFQKTKNKVENDRFAEGIHNIMSYNGSPQEDVKEE